MDNRLAYTGAVTPLFQDKHVLPLKYRNPSLEPFSGQRITARMVGCTTYPSIGAVITYNWYGQKIYDVMDFPDNPKELNDARKKRYMELFGTKRESVAKALIHPLSFSASIGSLWGSRIRSKKKAFEAVLHVHSGGWLEIVSGRVVNA